MLAWAVLVSATVLPPRKIGWTTCRVVKRPFRKKKVGAVRIEYESCSSLLYSSDSVTLGRQLATAWASDSSVCRRSARLASRSGLLLYVVDSASIRLCDQAFDAAPNPAARAHTAVARASLKLGRIRIQEPSFVADSVTLVSFAFLVLVLTNDGDQKVKRGGGAKPGNTGVPASKSGRPEAT